MSLIKNPLSFLRGGYYSNGRSDTMFKYFNLTFEGYQNEPYSIMNILTAFNGNGTQIKARDCTGTQSYRDSIPRCWKLKINVTHRFSTVIILFASSTLS